MMSFVNRNIVVFAAMLASVGGIIFGYDLAVIAGALEPLRESLGLSDFEASVFVSTINVGTFIGALIGGKMVDSIGRRNSIVIVSVLFAVGALMLFFTSSFIGLLIGRFIVGVGVALSAIADCVYITELSPPEIRGIYVQCIYIHTCIHIYIYT